jgi:hypothetical protein
MHHCLLLIIFASRLCIALVRVCLDTENMIDFNAMWVLNEDGKKLGRMAKEQSSLLAPICQHGKAKVYTRGAPGAQL